MKNKLIYKIVLIAVLFFTINYFSNDFSLHDIEKTAIVVALGIDYNQGEYDVTAQIAIPQESTTTSENIDSVISAKGKTIAKAISEIGARTGWYPKLSFCNIVVIGSKTAETGVNDVIDYTMRSTKLLDSAIMVVAENTAKQLLTSTTPLDSVTSFALLKILVKNTEKTDVILTNDIKDFAKETSSFSKVSVLPIVKEMQSREDDSKSNSSSDSSGGENNEQGEGSGKEKSGNGNVIYDATNSAVFSDGKIVSVLTHTESLVLQLCRDDTDLAFLEKEFKDEIYLFRVKSDSIKKGLKYNDGKFTYTLGATVKLKIVDVTGNKHPENSKDTDTASDALLSSVKTYLEQETAKLVEKTLSENIDLFGLKNELYQRYPRLYHKYKDEVLSSALYKINFKVKKVI